MLNYNYLLKMSDNELQPFGVLRLFVQQEQIINNRKTRLTSERGMTKSPWLIVDDDIVRPESPIAVFYYLSSFFK